MCNQIKIYWISCGHIFAHGKLIEWGFIFFWFKYHAKILFIIFTDSIEKKKCCFMRKKGISMSVRGGGERRIKLQQVALDKDKRRVQLRSINLAILNLIEFFIHDSWASFSRSQSDFSGWTFSLYSLNSSYLLVLSLYTKNTSSKFPLNLTR